MARQDTSVAACRKSESGFPRAGKPGAGIFQAWENQAAVELFWVSSPLRRMRATSSRHVKPVPAE
jgi:hypothetical protein